MDDVAILRAATINVDNVGNETRTYEEKQVFCKARGVTRREFYEAAQAGMRPSVVLSLSSQADYSGEEEAEWRGTVYKVIRTYWTDAGDGIELTLEERTSGYGN